VAAVVVVIVASLVWVYWPSAPNPDRRITPAPIVSNPPANPNPPIGQPTESLPPAKPAPENPAPRVNAADTSKKVKATLAEGDSYYDDGKYDRAIAAYEAGLAVDRNNTELRQRVQRAKAAEAAESSVPR